LRGVWVSCSIAAVCDAAPTVVSGNSIEHAMLALAAMHVGVAYEPVSPAYSLVSKDFGKLKHNVALLEPGLVFAGGKEYGPAIAAAVPAQTELVVLAKSAGCTSFEDLARIAPGGAVQEAHARVDGDTIAKFLFTSGSTGFPKAVINTHRMLCSNQQMILQVFPFLEDEPPVLVDWLPWNHTFGGNHNFGMALFNGGSLHIDDGRPMPGAIERTARNLREIAPTVYFNVPRGFEALIPYLRKDAGLRSNFFGRLSMMFYAGAGMAQHVWDDLDRLSGETCGERVLMATGLGATETAPSVTFTNWDSGRAGVIGLPAPGQSLKLVPSAGKLEMRVLGPNVTPGYWKDEALTRAAFDDEGYYRLGDAVRFLDPGSPEKGLLFDGRIAEDFKLDTGTWVNVASIRAKLISETAPFTHDAVIAGHDRDAIGALIFPNAEACKTLGEPELRERFQRALDRLAEGATGTAQFVARAMLLDAPPSLDLGEVTDKGSINQRAVLKCRSRAVEELYAAETSPRILIANKRRAP
jgi:feruloyl-CoA synthase